MPSPVEDQETPVGDRYELDGVRFVTAIPSGGIDRVAQRNSAALVGIFASAADGSKLGFVSTPIPA